MTEEMTINMITNCAKMEVALGLLRQLMVNDMKHDRTYHSLDLDEINMVLMVAGMDIVEEQKEKDQTAGEQ